MRIRLVPIALIAIATPCNLSAQQTATNRPLLTPAEYGRWERLLDPALSPNGEWVAVPVTRVERTSELRVYRVRAGADTTPFVATEGRDPVFTDDSRWLAYAIGQSEAERTRLEKEKKPVRDGAGLRKLETGETVTFTGIRRFAFGASRYLALLEYGAERKGDPGDADSSVQSADLIVRDLATGAEMRFGNVTGFAWQDSAAFLAMTVETPDRAGNGIYLYAPRTGRLSVLDGSRERYRGLAWRKDADDLAVLRSLEVSGWEQPTHEVLVWRGLTRTPRASRFDPRGAAALPAAMRLAEHRPVSWSDDGERVFFGIQEWFAKPDTTARDSSRAGGEDEPADVEVWHSADRRIIPIQRVRKEQDRQATYLAGWNLASGRFVRIGTNLRETATVLEGQRFATETDGQPYAFDNMFDTPRQDIWLVDLATGERRKVIEGVWYFRGASPGGRFLLYFHDDRFYAYDVSTGARADLTGKLATTFVDREADWPVRRQRRPWGVGGWLDKDAAVLLYDRHDVWAVKPDGTGGVRLTGGAVDSVRHRVVLLDPEAKSIDPAKPLYLDLYGEWTKRFGFGRLALKGAAPQGVVQRLMFQDRRVSRLARAQRADVFTYVVDDFDDSPDVFAGGPELSGARQVTRTNPFQAEYAWGRSELVDYACATGKRVQGALFYPAGYQAGRRYPMIVYVYERLSQGVHSYVVPDERSAYNLTAFTQHGYFVLEPDIVYQDRRPGTSAVGCVEPAVQAVLAKGLVDAEHVGLVGHSWGGYQASFIPTQTNIFAAAVAGAAITNFYSFFGAVHWNGGFAESSHFETGQARMDVPYWEDMEAYARESPAMHITRLQTPMLLYFGDKDGTVDWHQGVELYNYARRAGKNLVMLVYPGEDHSPRQKKNQIDYHRRVLQWFGHYLKGEAPPGWITDGQALLERERELKSLRATSGR
jgi:dipeptidyl aminopeptidase/acylaminoacyl peptidase